MREWGRTIRTLVRRPGYSMAVVGTLALGFGAATAVASAAYGVLLEPLALPEPERLVAVWMTQDGETTNLSGPNGLDLRNGVEAFEGLYLFTRGQVVLEEGEGGRVRPAEAVQVSSDMLGVLGVRPYLGRDLAPADMLAGAPPVVLLSYGLWRDAFGEDPSWVGRTTLVDGAPTQIVGVLPPQLEIPLAGSPRVVAPLHESGAFVARDLIWLGGVARLAEGAVLVTARAEADGVWESLRESFPDVILDAGVAVLPLRSHLVAESRGPLLILLAAAGLLLVIAAVNAGGLMLARGRTRGAELALRASLGANRGQVAGPLMLEGMALALVATGAGVVLARWLLAGILAYGPAELPRSSELVLDGWVLLVGIAGALGVGLTTAGVTSARALREAPATSLSGGGRGTVGRRGARRGRFLTVGVQVGLATVLLGTAGLLVRSFVSLTRVDPGYRIDDISMARIQLPEAGYSDAASRADLLRRALDRIRAEPGIEAAGLALLEPLDEARINYEVALDGLPPAPPGEAPLADLQLVSEGYFETMEIPLLAGRSFTPADRDGPLVAVVTAQLANTLWGGSPAVGRRIGWVVDREAEPRWFEVVGVVADVRQQSLTAEARGTLILDLFQRPQSAATLVARTRGDAAAFARVVRNEIPALGAGIPEPEVGTLRASLSTDVAPARFLALLLAVFSGMAVTLATVGTYGTLAYALSRRRREMGVRIAMGAPPQRVVRDLLVQAMTPVVMGLGAGLSVILLAGGSFRGLLHDVPARDPVSLVATLVILGAAAFAACLLAALRAIRTDPVQSLRDV